MNKVFVTSDLHFWHKNVMKYENRPWETVEQMNQGLIDNWNSVVDSSDTVYILGDLSLNGWSKVKDIVEQLNGNKIMIVGNHDSKWLRSKELDKYFVEITHYKKLKYKDHIFVMSHYPIACWEGMEHGYIHLYGHIHGNSHNLPQGFNKFQSYHVGVDTNHYKPVDLDWLIDLKEKMREPEKYIPKNTPYCYTFGEPLMNGFGFNIEPCPFHNYADNRPEQQNGYCHLLDIGDWQENAPDLLWDGCKCCGINDYDETEENE